MQRSTNRRIRKLEELVGFMFSEKIRKCFFCKVVLEYKDFKATTIHHINGIHEDDRPENKTLSHRRCHKAFHLKERRERR